MKKFGTLEVDFSNSYSYITGYGKDVYNTNTDISVSPLIDNLNVTKEGPTSNNTGKRENVIISKTDKSALDVIANSLKEKEILKKEIKRLKKENEELRKESEYKRLYKDYILGIDKIMNQLPPTKDYSKKLELIQRFIDFSLALFNILDKIPLNKSARFGYSERNLFIRYCFKISYDEVLRQISDLNKGINDIGDIPKEGISIANISNIRTKDDLCLKVLKKLANLD